MLRGALLLALLASCETFFPLDPPTPTNDGSISCTGDEDCAAPVGVCETDMGICVACTADRAEACTGTTPVCGDDNVCHKCTSHTDCIVSNACLPDGACGAPADVAYVADTGTGTACTLTAPCPTLTAALATNRPVIKIAAGSPIVDTAAAMIDSRTVTIVADPGAALGRSTPGPILQILGAASVTIVDLAISNQTGATDAAIFLGPNGARPSLSVLRVKIADNQGHGVGGIADSVTIDQSIVSNNTAGGIVIDAATLIVSQSTIDTNAGGGIALNGATARVQITNNFIVRNGNSTTTLIGGVSLRSSALEPDSSFEFNTVVDNEIQATTLSAAGVVCDAAGFLAPNNLIVRNFVANDATRSNSNTIGECTYPTSTIATTTAGLGFAEPDNAAFDYHITAGSTAVDKATTPSMIAVDVDNEKRPIGNAADQGAHELQ